jgi:ubiquinone/menaquinone biosynthesis C-methylase UbiE
VSSDKKSQSKTIENTGERMVPAFQRGKLEYGEHIARYEALAGMVEGKTVLDIASGSGFGTEIISRWAKKVYGVDYSDDAIEYAKANFSNSKTVYMQGDATAIPIEDKSLDVVISFETLEHIENYKKFIEEIRRVLKPDGLLVLSTPNDIEFPEGADFHVHEFKDKELQTLVKKYFKNLKPYYEVTWKYAAILDEKTIAQESSLSINTFNLAPVNLKKALYFYFLCSNRPIKETVAPVGAISEHWSTRELLEHNADMDKYIRKTMKHYEGILSKKDEEIINLHKQLKQSKIIRNSKRAARLIKRKTKSLSSRAGK